MRNKKFVNDVDYLLKALHKKHKDLDALIPFQKLEIVSEEIKENISSDSFNPKYLSIELQKLFSVIKDAHSLINRWNEPKTPYYFEYVDSNYYPFVVPKTKAELLCIKLVSVNGISISELTKLLDSYLVYDNIEALRIGIARALNDYNLIRFVTKSNNRNIVYGFENGVEVETGKRNNSTMQTSIYWQKGNEFLRERASYFILNLEQSLYIKYTRCREDSDYTLSHLVKDVKESLKSSPRKIIVDFRNNQGGNSDLFNRVANVLKKYIDKNNPKVYCLINRRIFSSGTINTFDMKYKLGAILVGQPAAQGINHFGYTKTFELPNSKLEVNYSSEYWKFIHSNSPIIEPDVYIEPKIEDYVNGNDVVLKYCLNKT